jgi:hypothetical protein
MKCPNCSSPMFVANQDASERSLVKFFRCTICVGEHVVSEPVASIQYAASSEADYIAPGFGSRGKLVQMA